MAHLYAFIPACESYGWAGGPEFKTEIDGLRSGRNRRNGQWDLPKYKFSLPFRNIGQSEYATILNQFLVCKGQLHTFLYRNRLDDVAIDEPFGIGDGTTKEFQLSKVSLVDGVSFERPVFALFVPGAGGAAEEANVSVSAAGAPVSAVSIDHDRGRVVFDTAPALGAALTWSGRFAHWVRFAQDWLPFSIDNYSADEYVTNGTVDLVDDQPPESSRSSAI